MYGMENDYIAKTFQEAQEKLDLNPTCEWNYTLSRRYFLTFWKITRVDETCTRAATWIVFIDIEECIKDHDHIVFLCTRHKNYMKSNKLNAIECNELNKISENWSISKIEAL